MKGFGQHGSVAFVLLAAAVAACAAEPEGQPSDDARPGEVGEGRDGAPPGANSGANRDGGLDEVGAGMPDGSVHDADVADDAGLDAAATVDAGKADAGGVDASKIDAAGADASKDATVTDAAMDAAGPGVDAGPPLDCTKLGKDGEPLDLGCTGLYANWATRSVASTARAYEPPAPVRLWSDGAEKSRFISLPPGTQIDTSNLDEWSFPVGTRMWKEFRLAGRRVETRMMWKKTGSQWVRTTYAWSYDQSTATELTTGAQNVFGTTYEIPAQADCEICHMGRLDNVLGFEIIGLSRAGATGLTMQALIAENLVTQAPATLPVIPGNATEAAALGWLHANCGTACHNRSNYALAKSTGLFMRLDVAKLASVTGTDTYATAVNVPSTFQPTPGAGFLRIKPRDNAHSCIPYRDGTRVKGEQMPPMATHIVDTAGLALVKSWIDAM